MSSELAATVSECPTTPQDWEIKTTVCITGGCGFLAQHLIKQLNLYTTNIECVRVLDFSQFVQTLEYPETIETHSIIGSVTVMEDLLTATEEATTVFHLTSFHDRTMFPDDSINKEINIEGTRNVIKACQENNVRNLIYVSDTSVVKSYNSIVLGKEENTSYPKKHLFPDGEAQAAAERLVLGANGLVLSDPSSKLRTMCIRPVTLYGELDSFLLPQLVDLAISNDGHIPCIGSLRSRHQFMYVGNLAWALLCANRVLNKMSAQDPPSVSTDVVVTSPLDDVKGEGKAYFICDDTPPINFFLFIQPILYRYGYFLTSWSLPEKWAKRVATVVYVVALILYPFIMCNPRVTINDVHHVCRTYTFSDKLAREQLGYLPIFNPKEGMLRTTEFYDTKYKEAMMSHLVDHALSSKHVGMLRRMSTIKRDVAGMDMTDTGRRFRAKVVDDNDRGWLPL